MGNSMVGVLALVTSRTTSLGMSVPWEPSTYRYAVPQRICMFRLGGRFSCAPRRFKAKRTAMRHGHANACSTCGYNDVSISCLVLSVAATVQSIRSAHWTVSSQNVEQLMNFVHLRRCVAADDVLTFNSPCLHRQWLRYT